VSETTEQYTEQGFDGHEAERTADSLWSADLGSIVTVTSVDGVIATGELSRVAIDTEARYGSVGRRGAVRVVPRITIELSRGVSIDLNPGSVVRFQ